MSRAEAPPLRPSRRRLLAGVAIASLIPVGFVTEYLFRLPEGPILDAPAAHREATAGRLLLIDIRRPDEWQASGSAAPAKRLDMRREDFTDALLALAKGDRAAPLALICARGVRSARLAERLRQAGFTRVSDVAEGMFGSRAGPGWIARGLPVTRD
jgi:rhodanese-related sulfurtransferase